MKTKRLITTLFVAMMLVGAGCCFGGAYSPYPQPMKGFVSDFAELLSVGQEKELNQLLENVEDKTGVEIAVVTIKAMADYPKSGQTIEQFSRELFDKYGIGKAAKNNGILLLLSQKDRKVRIELGQFYGRDYDQQAAEIMQNTIIPFLKEGRYDDGLIEGTEALIDEFTTYRFKVKKSLIVWLILLPILALIGYSLYKNGKRGWGWVVAGIFIIIMLILFKLIAGLITALCSDCGCRHRRGYRNYYGSSSSGGFFSGGGFGGGSSGGGFGGGSSGGGGATGSW